MSGARLAVIIFGVVASSACRGGDGAGRREVAEGVTSPQLVRCMEAQSQACFRTTVRLDPGSARSGLASPAAWSARIGEIDVPVSRVSTTTIPTGRTRLMILVDGSRSMSDGTLNIVRSVLRSFLSVQQPGLEVAVAPFSSVRVEERIDRASFDSPDVAAGALLDLPPPSGNSALYSAVLAGTRFLEAAASGNPGGLDVLLVITDGGNEVGGPGDDSGLLFGASGRDAATELLRQTGVFLWVVAVGGGADPSEMQALTNSTGASLAVPLPEPVLLGHALDRVSASLQVGREVVVELPVWLRRGLDRGPMRVVLTRSDSAGSNQRYQALWAGPRFTRAAFEGPPAGLAAPEGRVVAVRDRPVVRASGITAMFALLALLVLQILPPLLWPRPDGSGMRVGPSKRRLKKRGGRGRDSSRTMDGTGSLSNARARDPRGVDDATASRARRTET